MARSDSDSLVLALAPAPPAPSVLALAAPGLPPVIQIGPARYNYVYRQQFASGVYRCDTYSEWGRVGDRLFLFKNPDGPGP
jgi:hypothetical protein